MECVFIILAILVYDVGSAVVEVLLDFVIAVEYFFEVVFSHIRVTALVHYSLDCCFTGSLHQTHLD